MAPMRRDGADVGWSLVVPLKPLLQAKSRLSRAAGEEFRPRLALAFALDTVTAALACKDVRDVAVVTDDRVAGERLAALGARIVPDTPAGGLNAALAHGAGAVRARRPGAAVAALNADLPALRPAELEQVLHSASLFPRAFLADAADIGTTLLTATSGVELEPAFGGASRARHLASGAREIITSTVPSVRRDVDTGEDLLAALALGVGPHTALQAPHLAGVAGRSATVTEAPDGSSRLLPPQVKASGA
ncbi:2-phospho-L-lactate guanylyltransferase [Streptomyces sp. 2224.1]|uniref:2-phospho-L-lactate guanylyltransferase n=1 Tax=unclassified Streptomyces TaxID=2593676 RepID=UPI00088C14BE|nr:2-phospho-L-lactate guanylyltransferase [Streptomyces sp. 2321.6]SDR18449.1 2-phospho-L-lactate guanylyltransferase [Streptomyces sp. KS_16]SEB50725.1 2-phospho-L-lactate guanylyltransferase [Streptomyces sp. 2224.1]SED62546.1 2-phospho-L-lactate guanylyltransferase [Streptomyces sp. 2133.1]SNC71346.1 2-phospho-L-lactate guanylyltransferase [Streptomyces sp. 2114.4]